MQWGSKQGQPEISFHPLADCLIASRSVLLGRSWTGALCWVTWESTASRTDPNKNLHIMKLSFKSPFYYETGTRKKDWLNVATKIVNRKMNIFISKLNLIWHTDKNPNGFWTSWESFPVILLPLSLFPQGFLWQDYPADLLKWKA